MAADAPSRSAYDVVVIGAGLGGLTAAALLADAGLGVLVVERQSGPGGVAHMFRRGPYSFDPGIHVMGMWNDGLYLDLLMRRLGVRDHVHPIQQPVAYGASFPGLRANIPRGWDELVEAHVKLFPKHARDLRAFLDLVRHVHQDIHQCPPFVPFDQLDAMAERFPWLMANARRTLAEALATEVADPRVRAFLGAPWPWFGEPPSRLAMIWHSQIVRPMAHFGAFHLRGGFETLAAALVRALQSHGGEIVFGRRVDRILVRDERAGAVMLDDGGEISARVVLSNADGSATLTTMLEGGTLPDGFKRRLARLQPSLSAAAIYTATDMDLRPFDMAHETMHHVHWDHDLALADINAGRPGGMWLSIPSLVDPTLAPPGESVVILTSMARYDLPWAELKEPFGEALLDNLEGLFPGYRDHLRHYEVITPLTVERILATREGAIYGWAHIPTQMGSRRLPFRSPIDGLYLTGMWVSGLGSPRVVLSGIQASEIILTDLGLGDRAFRAPDVPSAARMLSPEAAASSG